jgi:hypothetical protein
MFDIEICESRNAILVRFQGELSACDFADLDDQSRKLKDVQQACCIFDMTGVDKVAQSIGILGRHGDLPQAFKERQRIYVVPQPDLKLLVRLYADYQTYRGDQPPQIVEFLEETIALVGVALPPSRFPSASPKAWLS